MGYARRQQSGNDDKIIRQESNVKSKEEYKNDELKLEDITDGEFEREEELSVFTKDKHMPSSTNKNSLSVLKNRLSLCLHFFISTQSSWNEYNKTSLNMFNWYYYNLIIK